MVDGLASARACFVYYCRDPRSRDLQSIRRLRRQLGPRADLYLLTFVADQDGGQSRSMCHDLAVVAHHVVDYPQLKSDLRDYPRKISQTPEWRLMPGNTDTPFLHFFRTYPNYEYYWLMEDDVVFTGDMGRLLADFADSDSDLLATSIRPPSTNWWHLPSLRFGWDGEESERLTAFFPFCRLSRAMLQAIDRAYAQGWAGHYEVAWPTIALRNLMNIEDFGGDSAYVRAGNINRYYTSTLSARTLFPGTFRFYPPRLLRPLRKDTLYHPVKSLGSYLRRHRKFIRNRVSRGIKGLFGRLRPR